MNNEECYSNNVNSDQNKNNFKQSRIYLNFDNVIKYKYFYDKNEKFEDEKNLKKKIIKLTDLFKVFLKKKKKKNLFLKKNIYSNSSLLIFKPVFDNFFNKKHFTLRIFFFYFKNFFFTQILIVYYFLKKKVNY
jgi:hypothetical protein